MKESGIDEGIKDITIEPADIKREYSKLHMQTFNHLQEMEHLLRKFHDILQKNPKELSGQLNIYKLPQCTQYKVDNSNSPISYRFERKR